MRRSLSTGGAFAAGRFGAAAARLALARGKPDHRAQSAWSLSGYSVPSGAPGLHWWGHPTLSPDTTTDTASVSTYTDHSAAAFGALTNTGSNRPTYAANGLGTGKPSLHFVAGSSQKLAGSASPPYAGPTIGSALIVVAKIAAAPADSGNGYSNGYVLGDGDNGYQAIAVRTSTKVQGYLYDGSNHVAEAGAGNGFAFNTVLLLTMRAYGNFTGGAGTISMQVNNNAAVTVGSIGLRTSITSPFQIGHGAGGYMSMDIGHNFICDDDAAVVAAIQEFCRTEYALW